MFEPDCVPSIGDVLCSIEAIKIETAIHAEVDDKIVELIIKPSDQIDAKALLLNLG